MKRGVNSRIKQYAKELRQNMTKAEKRLWSHLNAKKLLGLRVRRQHPIGSYIADFCIEQIKLVIEIDGYTHDYRSEKDQIRDQFMNTKGYEVVRIKSVDVMEKLEDVVEFIKLVCERKLELNRSEDIRNKS